MVSHDKLRRAAAGVGVTAGLVVAAVAPASADNGVDSSALRNAVTVTGVLGHERALQRIANANGGTRAAGTPGYEASGRYVEGLLGAAGCWSIFAWMGPWPVLRLRDACQAGDWATAQRIGMDLATRAANEDLYWRESGSKLAINFAGYCDAGPLRPPFRHIPEEVVERTRAIANRWQSLVAKYGPVGSEARAG